MTANLTGKKVLITAAAQGIGQASALAFARAGATVHATDINAEALAKLGNEPGVTTHILNVLEADAVSKLVAEIGDIDVLFNCAGVVHGGSVLEMKDSDLEFAFDLNVKAMIRTIRAVLPGMLARGDGSIVNMSSVASSIKGVPNRFAYGVTKAAVIGLTKAHSCRLCRAGHPLQCHLPWHGRKPVAAGNACARRATTIPPAPPSSPASRWAGWARRKRSPASRSISPAPPIQPARQATPSTAAGRSNALKQEHPYETSSLWYTRRRKAGHSRRRWRDP